MPASDVHLKNRFFLHTHTHSENFANFSVNLNYQLFPPPSPNSQHFTMSTVNKLSSTTKMIRSMSVWIIKPTPANWWHSHSLMCAQLMLLRVLGHFSIWIYKWVHIFKMIWSAKWKLIRAYRMLCKLFAWLSHICNRTPHLVQRATSKYNVVIID